MSTETQTSTPIENDFEASQRYREELREVEGRLGPNHPFVEAKRDTTQLLVQRAIAKKQLPMPTGEPNRNIPPYEKS